MRCPNSIEGDWKHCNIQWKIPKHCRVQKWKPFHWSIETDLFYHPLLHDSILFLSNYAILTIINFIKFPLYSARCHLESTGRLYNWYLDCILDKGKSYSLSYLVHSHSHCTQTITWMGMAEREREREREWEREWERKRKREREREKEKEGKRERHRKTERQRGAW